MDVEEFIEGMTFDDFSKDKKTVNATIRSLEVLGEATRHIPMGKTRWGHEDLMKNIPEYLPLHLTLLQPISSAGRLPADYFS